jgi:opacity protein-like surface antigen
MTIKSLLLGSAAALVAVSGARAADAVMAEPEAVEYVRVCDAYGAGYFYIPGTETCLQIAGRVRYQINYNSIVLSDGWGKQAQGLLKFTAKSDTELGTLTSYIEMEANNISGGGKGDFELAHAWIQLGGLKMGYSDTLFDGGINGEFDSFGGAGIHFMGYTFSNGNGFSFTLNLEEADFNVDYMPNVVAKASYSQGAFGLDAWAAYDATAEEFALKAILTAKVSDPLTLQLGATYNSDPNFYDNDADWSVGASAKYQVNEKLALTAGAQYFGGSYYTNDGEWSAGIVANYTIVPQFTVELAVSYFSDNPLGVPAPIPASTDSYVGGYLRFQREF